MKDKCRFDDQLSAFMDGELTTGQRRQVQLHLEECEKCRHSLAILRMFNDQVADMPEIEPSPAFERALLERIAIEGQRLDTRRTKTLSSFFRRLLMTWKAPVTFASIAVIAALVTFMAKPSGLDNEDIVIASHMELLKDYDVINNLELLENMELFLPKESDS